MFCRFAFGDQTVAECLRSIELFARDVMPALADADAGFAPQAAALK
jgi:hypothetical protein